MSTICIKWILLNVLLFFSVYPFLLGAAPTAPAAIAVQVTRTVCMITQLPKRFRYGFHQRFFAPDTNLCIVLLVCLKQGIKKGTLL
jgi:hypothetical protein